MRKIMLLIKLIQKTFIWKFIFFWIKHIYLLIKKIVLFIWRKVTFAFNKIKNYIAFRENLLKKYKELKEKNIEITTQNCIEGIGGLKNIQKIKSTVNTLRIWVSFKDLLDLKKIKDCSLAGFNISDNLVEIVSGSEETKEIYKKIKWLWEKVNNSHSPFSEDSNISS